jgi:hypothetical protein
LPFTPPPILHPITPTLRIEFPGTINHLTSGGERSEPIFEDDSDRTALLGVLEEGMQRFDAQVLAYCLWGNHDYFVLHTRLANLSRLRRHLNDMYTQALTRRHRMVESLSQSRFKAILVGRDAYLQEICRYVELNPARMHADRAGGVSVVKLPRARRRSPPPTVARYGRPAWLLAARAAHHGHPTLTRRGQYTALSAA